MTSAVSETEILSQVREMGLDNPQANALLRQRRRGGLSTQDVLYFLLLDERARRRALEDEAPHGPAWDKSHP